MKIYLDPTQNALHDVFHVNPQKNDEIDEVLVELFSHFQFTLEGGQQEIRDLQDDILAKLQEESPRCTTLQELALLFFKAGISVCSMQYMIQAARAGVKEIQEQKNFFRGENLN